MTTFYSSETSKGEDSDFFISQYPLLQQKYEVITEYEYTIDPVTNDTISRKENVIDSIAVGKLVPLEISGWNHKTDLYIGLPEMGDDMLFIRIEEIDGSLGFNGRIEREGDHGSVSVVLNEPEEEWDDEILQAELMSYIETTTFPAQVVEREDLQTRYYVEIKEQYIVTGFFSENGMFVYDPEGTKYMERSGGAAYHDLTGFDDPVIVPVYEGATQWPWDLIDPKYREEFRYYVQINEYFPVTQTDQIPVFDEEGEIKEYKEGIILGNLILNTHQTGELKMKVIFRMGKHLFDNTGKQVAQDFTIIFK